MKDSLNKFVREDLSTELEYAKTAARETWQKPCLLYTSPSPRDLSTSRMPSSA